MIKPTLLVIEKNIIRAGAIMGVIATILLLRSEVLKPTSPNVDVTFLLSSTDEINYALQTYDRSEKHSELFPLGLMIRNEGDSTANGVILSLIPESGLTLEFDELEVETRNVVTEDGLRPLYRLKLGIINPAETVYLDKNIWCRGLNINRVQVTAYNKRGDEWVLPSNELRITYDLEARFSATNAILRTKHLYITTGRDDYFKKNNKTYYYFKDGKLAFHKGET